MSGSAARKITSSTSSTSMSGVTFMSADARGGAGRVTAVRPVVEMRHAGPPVVCTSIDTARRRLFQRKVALDARPQPGASSCASPECADVPSDPLLPRVRGRACCSSPRWPACPAAADRPAPTTTGFVVSCAAQVLTSIGQTTQCSAIESLSDGSTADRTAAAQWSSSTPATATVSPAGLVTAVQAGSTQITATYSAFSVTSTIQVSTITAVIQIDLLSTRSSSAIANATRGAFRRHTEVPARRCR